MYKLQLFAKLFTLLTLHDLYSYWWWLFIYQAKYVEVVL